MVFLTSARRGQGAYRKNLIHYWKACAVTGVTSQRILLASHIKPWRCSSTEERLSTFNGLLLSPNPGKTFDPGYISFDSDGAIRISEQLEQPDKPGIHSGMGIHLDRQHQVFLEYHRGRLFRQY